MIPELGVREDAAGSMPFGGRFPFLPDEPGDEPGEIEDVSMPLIGQFPFLHRWVSSSRESSVVSMPLIGQFPFLPRVPNSRSAI